MQTLTNWPRDHGFRRCHWDPCARLLGETHLEGTVGAASYYVQGGASFVSPDGGESDTVPSGKAGLGVPVTDALGAYGEVSFIGSGDDDIDRGYGAKLGMKYNF